MRTDSKPDVKPDERHIRAELAKRGFFTWAALGRKVGARPCIITRLMAGQPKSRAVADRIAELIGLPTPEVFPVYKSTERKGSCRAA